MENQEKKSVKPIVIAVIITLLFSAGVVYWGGQTVVQGAYDRGHVNGYADGIAKRSRILGRVHRWTIRS